MHSTKNIVLMLMIILFIIYFILFYFARTGYGYTGYSGYHSGSRLFYGWAGVRTYSNQNVRSGSVNGSNVRGGGPSGGK